MCTRTTVVLPVPVVPTVYRCTSVQQEEATVLLRAVVLLSCAHTYVKLHVLVEKLVTLTSEIRIILNLFCISRTTVPVPQ